MSIKAHFIAPHHKPSIAIVGGKGYLGGSFHAYCREQALRSWVVGRQSDSKGIGTIPDAYRSSIPRLQSALEGASAVLHLATLTTPSTGEMNPALDLENIAFTQALVQACLKSKVHHVVFASSGGTIYGEISKPASERTPANPVCSYGIAKLASEQYLQTFARNTGTHVTILRMSNVFGGKQIKKGDQGVISYLVDQIERNREVLLLGDTVRDYVCIHDVLEAFHKALEHPSGFQLYNISTGIGTSLLKLTQLIYRLFGKKEKITVGDRRHFDVAYNVLKNDKARQQLGWSPKHKLKGCLIDYLQEYRQRA